MVLCGIVLGLTLGSLPLQARPAITLRVTPGPITTAPARLRLEIRYQPLATDRRITVVLDGDGAYSQSDLPLDPTQRPFQRTVYWRIHAPGAYRIGAGIGDGQRLRAFTHQPLYVLGR
jgi:hypothetical protein